MMVVDGFCTLLGLFTVCVPVSALTYACAGVSPNSAGVAESFGFAFSGGFPVSR
jgi:hypothetical protein